LGNNRKLKESLEKKEPKKSKKVDTNELWFADDVNASDLDKVYTTNEEREEKKTNIVKKMDSATGKAAE
jgi:hypothetical protein